MFEVGFTELLVVFALALVVLGPERLPRLTAKVGRWIGRARAMARQFRDQLEAEAQEAEASIDPFATRRGSAEPTTPAPTPTPATTTPASDPPSEPPRERGT